MAPYDPARDLLVPAGKAACRTVEKSGPLSEALARVLSKGKEHLAQCSSSPVSGTALDGLPVSGLLDLLSDHLGEHGSPTELLRADFRGWDHLCPEDTVGLWAAPKPWTRSEDAWSGLGSDGKATGPCSW